MVWYISALRVKERINNNASTGVANFDLQKSQEAHVEAPKAHPPATKTIRIWAPDVRLFDLSKMFF